MLCCLELPSVELANVRGVDAEVTAEVVECDSDVWRERHEHAVCVADRDVVAHASTIAARISRDDRRVRDEELRSGRCAEDLHVLRGDQAERGCSTRLKSTRQKAALGRRRSGTTWQAGASIIWLVMTRQL